MASVKLAAVALTLTLASPCAAKDVADWRPYIDEASLRFGVPAAWIERVMRVESGGQTTLAGRPIRSPAGAMGLMQLMPGTWATMRRLLALGENPDDPHDNILAGALYLRMMYDRFGYPGMFAAYNAGPGRFATHIATGKVLPPETISYLLRLSITASGANRNVPIPSRETLFAVAQKRLLERAKADPDSASSDLFVVRNDAR
jgi:soluble lytic murein transglycosylase-like protein